MRLHLKVAVPLIALAVIASVFGIAKLRSHREEIRTTKDAGSEEALPVADGSVDGLFAAIDASSSDEDAYVSASADTTPTDETEGFDQLFNEEQI